MKWIWGWIRTAQVLMNLLYQYTTGWVQISSQTTCLWGWHLQPMTTAVYKPITNTQGLKFHYCFPCSFCISVFCFHCSLPALFSRLNLILLPTYTSKFCRSLFIILPSILGFATPYNLVWSVNLITVMFAKDHKEPSQLYGQKRKKGNFYYAINALLKIPLK